MTSVICVDFCRTGAREIQACEEFEKKGIEFVKKPYDVNMKGLAFIKDPDGYWIEILQANMIEKNSK